MSPEEQKPPMNPQVAAAWIALAGTILTCLTGIYTAGKKSNEASDRPVSFVANLQAGFTLINPSKPASDSFQASLRQPSAVPAAAPIPSNVPVAPAPPATGTIENGTCSGLDPKSWAVQIAPVTILKGKDVANHEVSGYNINLRLSNLSDRIVDLKHQKAELTDDQGNQLPLTSTSVPNDDLSAPVEVSPGSDLPVNLKFLGIGEPGKIVSFDVSFHVTTHDEKPRLEQVVTLACTNMPL